MGYNYAKNKLFEFKFYWAFYILSGNYTPTSLTSTPWVPSNTFSTSPL